MSNVTVEEFEKQAEALHDALAEFLHMAQTEETPYSVDGMEDLEKALEQIKRLCNRFGK